MKNVKVGGQKGGCEDEEADEKKRAAVEQRV